uniref:Uncharacterized protein n=1 Tax=Ascaris lumbricoides TaxID=6252 RepID=A0A0M3I0S7_ASCLU
MHTFPSLHGGMTSSRRVPFTSTTSQIRTSNHPGTI